MLRSVLLLCIPLVLSALTEAAQGKNKDKVSPSASLKDLPASSMFVDFSKLEVVDLLRTGAVIIGFIFALLGDKRGETRVWRLVESIFMGLFGLAWIFFPSLMLGYITVGKVDGFHTNLGQGMGALFVALAVVSHRQYHANSKDSQVTAGWLLSRVVGFVFLKVISVYAKLSLAKENQRFSDQFVTFNGIAFGLLLIGSFIKLWHHYSSGVTGGRSSSRGKPASVLNHHLLISLMLTLPGMIMYFGMPEFLISKYMDLKYDGIHLHLLRTIGVLGLTFRLQEITAFQYENDGDKRDFFIGHIVSMAIIIPMMFLNQYRHSLFTVKVFGVILAISFAYVGNSLCATFIRMKGKKN